MIRLKATIDKALIQLRMTREIQRLKSLVKELYGLENVIAKSGDATLISAGCSDRRF